MTWFSGLGLAEANLMMAQVSSPDSTPVDFLRMLLDFIQNFLKELLSRLLS